MDIFRAGVFRCDHRRHPPPIPDTRVNIPCLEDAASCSNTAASLSWADTDVPPLETRISVFPDSGGQAVFLWKYWRKVAENKKHIFFLTRKTAHIIYIEVGEITLL
jgi:hypothetical protein